MNENEPRKATDILLDIENKINILINQVSILDKTIKVLSNKINIIANKEDMKKSPTIETIMKSLPEKSDTGVLIEVDHNILVTKEPDGNRRVSRDSQPLQEKPQIKNEINIAPVLKLEKENSEMEVFDTKEILIPVTQKLMYLSGKDAKPLFMAEVEIINESGVLVAKKRTNAAGKWDSSLPLGKYKICVRKMEPITKTKTESFQNIVVDGSQVPLVLQMAIIK